MKKIIKAGKADILPIFFLLTVEYILFKSIYSIDPRTSTYIVLGLFFVFFLDGFILSRLLFAKRLDAFGKKIEWISFNTGLFLFTLTIIIVLALKFVFFI